MNKPILSICIPTYNRSKYLTECLNSIVCQFDNEEIIGNVEIVISDNASEDDTQKVVKDFQDKYKNIKYFRNENNLGFDRNVEKVIMSANGSFLWTLSDDDYIINDSLYYLIDVLKDNENVAWICISDNNLVDLRSFKDGNEWLKEMKLTGGKISSNIYNKRFLLGKFDKYFGNLWIHFSIAREVSVNREQLLIKNLFKAPDDNVFCRWAKGGKVLYTFTNLKIIIENLPKIGYDKKIVKNILKEISSGLPRQIASAKLNGLKIDFKKIFFLVKHFYKYPIKLLISIFIIFTPVKVLLFLKKLCIKQ